MSRCEHWDSGWCYHPEVPEATGCVGYDECSIIATDSDQEVEEHPVDYVCPRCGTLNNWEHMVDSLECHHCLEEFDPTIWETLFNGE